MKQSYPLSWCPHMSDCKCILSLVDNYPIFITFFVFESDNLNMISIWLNSSMSLILFTALQCSCLLMKHKYLWSGLSPYLSLFASILCLYRRSSICWLKLQKWRLNCSFLSLVFIFLCLRNIKGLIDLVKTSWLQSIWAQSGVRSSIHCRSFCEEEWKKAEICVRREQTPALLSTLLQWSTTLYIPPEAWMEKSLLRSASIPCVCVCVCVWVVE